MTELEKFIEDIRDRLREKADDNDRVYLRDVGEELNTILAYIKKLREGL